MFPPFSRGLFLLAIHHVFFPTLTTAQNSTRICDFVIPALRDPSDLDNIKNCTSITTSLAVSSFYNGTIVLPLLTELYELYVIGDDSYITAISMPSLITIGDITMSTRYTHSISFPVLQAAGQIDLWTPSLTVFEGTATLKTASTIVFKSHAIPSLEFTSVENVTDLYVNFTIPNQSITLSGNQTNLNVTAYGNTNTTFNSTLPSMGSVILRGMRNITLTSYSFSDLEITLNPELEELYFPNLKTLGPQAHDTYLESQIPPSADASPLPPTYLPGISGFVPQKDDVLMIAYNDRLKNVEFNTLNTADGSVEVTHNWFWHDFQGLMDLSKVKGSLLLNGDIADIGFFGLGAQAAVGASFNITTNSSLLYCGNVATSFSSHSYPLTCFSPFLNITCPSTPYASNHSLTTSSGQSYPDVCTVVSSGGGGYNLSKGAMIGIGVGVVMLGFLLSALVAVWVLRIYKWPGMARMWGWRRGGRGRGGREEGRELDTGPTQLS